MFRLSSRDLIPTKNKGQHDYVLTFCYSSKHALKNDVARLFCKMYRSAFPTEFVNEIASLVIITKVIIKTICIQCLKQMLACL
jgi:hypothetical protein